MLISKPSEINLPSGLELKKTAASEKTLSDASFQGRRSHPCGTEAAGGESESCGAGPGTQVMMPPAHAPEPPRPGCGSGQPASHLPTCFPGRRGGQRSGWTDGRVLPTLP